MTPEDMELFEQMAAAGIKLLAEEDAAAAAAAAAAATAASSGDTPLASSPEEKGPLKNVNDAKDDEDEEEKVEEGEEGQTEGWGWEEEQKEEQKSRSLLFGKGSPVRNTMGDHQGWAGDMGDPCPGPWSPVSALDTPKQREQKEEWAKCVEDLEKHGFPNFLRSPPPGWEPHPGRAAARLAAQENREPQDQQTSIGDLQHAQVQQSKEIAQMKEQIKPQIEQLKEQIEQLTEQIEQPKEQPKEQTEQTQQAKENVLTMEQMQEEIAQLKEQIKQQVQHTQVQHTQVQQALQKKQELQQVQELQVLRQAHVQLKQEFVDVQLKLLSERTTALTNGLFVVVIMSAATLIAVGCCLWK
jgi:hypothetical protein